MRPDARPAGGEAAVFSDPAPPRGPELAHLQPSNLLGALFFSACVGLTALSLFLSIADPPAVWLLGQVLLALALLQWFALLHEAGHNTLFRTPRLNRCAGRVASFFALIPFGCWKRVHGAHHHWTGWQDLDLTTAPLAPRPRSRAERLLVNVCWRLWLPLFSVVYRLNNFWNLPRLWRAFPRQRRRLTASVLLLAAAYAATVAAVGWLPLLRAAGLGLLLTLMFQDLLILSQHTHVPQQLSHGAAVRPVPPALQEVYTRSLRFPAWVSAPFLLHMDAHELHHMYPRVPGYHLRKIAYVPRNEVPWWRWLVKAKRLPGEVFLFQNRRQSGHDV
jgi:fatty acid desaturase